MPDMLYSRKWRNALRIARGALYTFALLFGVFGIFLTPKTISGAVGTPLTYWWSALAIVGAVISLTGIFRMSYRIEWVGTWSAGGAVLMYSMTVLGFMLEGEVTRATQASVAFGLATALAYRSIELAAKAATDRKAHEKEVQDSE